MYTYLSAGEEEGRLPAIRNGERAALASEASRAAEPQLREAQERKMDLAAAEVAILTGFKFLTGNSFWL